MKTIKVSTPIGKICSTDRTRAGITSVLALPKDKGDSSVWLCATNGHALAIVGTEGNVGVDRSYVPSELCKAPGKAGVRLTCENGNGKWESSKGKVAATDDDTFPLVDHVFPTPISNPIRVSLNARLLRDLADSLDRNGHVTLTLDGDKPEQDSGIMVTTSNPECFGIIMPLHVESGSLEDEREAFAAVFNRTK